MISKLYYKKWITKDGSLCKEPSRPGTEAEPIFDRNSNRDPENYFPSKDLAIAVNVAVMLGKPLLVTGPPGVGKTELANSIAHEMGGLPLHVFETKSTSISRDLFYTYDAISAFRSQSEDHEAKNFIEYQALGKAILSAFPKTEVRDFLSVRETETFESGQARSVVLIDEIDKAPRDFPNDILNEIDQMQFRVPELGNIQTPSPSSIDNFRPIVVITSNGENPLPNPFLRRCVYFHIKPQGRDELRRIVMARMGSEIEAKANLVEDALVKFNRIEGNIEHPISCAELLDWLRIVNYWQQEDGPIRPEILDATLSALVKGNSAQVEARRLLEIKEE